jgi:hypothetical protein
MKVAVEGVEHAFPLAAAALATMALSSSITVGHAYIARGLAAQSAAFGAGGDTNGGIAFNIRCSCARENNCLAISFGSAALNRCASAALVICVDERRLSTVDERFLWRVLRRIAVGTLS